MNALFCSDLHLTSAPRDEYRWKLFDFIHHFTTRNAVNYLFILGDLTDAKDYHSARLVNRVVDNLCELYRNHEANVHGIYIVGGNHDGIDPSTPYFRFLARFPFIKFITTPWSEEILGRRFLMLPHSRNAEEQWRDVDMHDAEYVLAHITVGGAVSESGIQLEGAPSTIFRTARRAKAILCGDVHVPQTVEWVTYIGAPYHVHFGDTFKPRMLHMKNWVFSDVHPGFQQRHTILIDAADDDYSIPDNVHPGDQVKFCLRLSRSQYVDWARYKRNVIALCKECEVELCGLELVRAKEKIKIRGPKILNSQTPEQIIRQYCTQNKLDDFIATAALQFIK